MESMLSPAPARKVVMNPYRKGIASGEAEGAAFIAWRDEAKASRDYSKPRPPRSVNPYAKGWSVKQWADGWKVGMRRAGVKI